MIKNQRSRAPGTFKNAIGNIPIDTKKKKNLAKWREYREQLFNGEKPETLEQEPINKTKIEITEMMQAIRKLKNEKVTDQMNFMEKSSKLC